METEDGPLLHVQVGPLFFRWYTMQAIAWGGIAAAVELVHG